jgi:hypothetical protein
VETLFDDERNEGWMIVDEPDVEVNVTESTFFRSLQGKVSLDNFPSAITICIPIQWPATHIDISTGVAALTGGLGVIVKNMQRR